MTEGQTVEHDPGEETGTPLGWHTYTCFRECPRQYYFKHVLGLVPRAEPRKPLAGKIFHAMKEAFYRGMAEDAILGAVLDPMLAKHSASFSDFDPASETRDLLAAAFANWLCAYGRRDLVDYEILGVETPFDLIFDTHYGPVHLTGRIDFVGRRRDDSSLFMHDTKTSFSTGPTKLLENVDCDDQLTVYAAAVREMWGAIPTCVADAVLFKGRSPQVGRGEFFRSDDEIIDAIEGLVTTKKDILRAMEALAAGQPWRPTFPRYTQKCSLWGCDYEDFCREGPDGIPDGFRVRPTTDVSVE